MTLRKAYLILLLLIAQVSFSQEGVSVYSDYLSDNLYLLHPSMAGAANCTKLRLTARQQWFGDDKAPSMQTLSFNGRIGEQSGAGIILVNDRNGYHSQKGVKLTYAHHIMFSRNELDLNQLSFGVNVGMFQNQLDETSFTQPDPIVGGNVQKASYYNMDFGASYNYLDFYTHFTVKNALPTDNKLYTDVESTNKRKYLWSAGYVFGGNEAFQWEPSFLFQYADQTKEKTVDLNIKLYKPFEEGKIWGALSYRQGLDQTKYEVNGQNYTQRLQYFTPVLGINYKQFMFAYTYSHLFGDVKFDQQGFHQITIGLNLWCKRDKFDCNCPAIN